MIICRECGHHNPSGTTFCANLECGAFLEWSGEQQATEMIPIPAPPPPPPPGSGWGSSGPGRAGKPEVGLTVQLDERELSVDPGAAVGCAITVRNTGRIVDRYAVRVLGDAERWAQADPPTINLVPAAEGSIEVTFTPPRRPDVVAGTRPFRLLVTSGEDARVMAFADGTITVAPYNDVATALAPPIAEGRSGTYQVGLENRGNAPVTARIEAGDDRRALAFRISQPALTLPPGARAAVAVHARPRDTEISGRPMTYPFRVVVQLGWDAPRSMDAQLVHKPPLPPFGPGWIVLMRVLFTLLGALLMVVGAFAEWYPDTAGTELTYENYVETVFQAETPAPPSGVDSVFVSVGLLPLVLAVFVLLGLASRRGLLTRLTAGFGLLVMIVFAFTVGNAGISVGVGIILVILGLVLALIGGICAMVGKS
ncbi:MAG TPA: hypothetical protein VFI47_19825 [Acidimicrobiales bacterium]|nr:hypothetical protein [Acidimicrobiales bacterium]